MRSLRKSTRFLQSIQVITEGEKLNLSDFEIEGSLFDIYTNIFNKDIFKPVVT